MEKEEKVWKLKEPWAGGGKFDGKYVGQLKNGKPHGLGMWKGKLGFYNATVEGEWKEGQLNGKVAENWSNGNRYEYESIDEKYNGK